MKIKSLLVMPGKEVQIARIPASIKYIKSLLGGDIYKITLNENTAIIASRSAKIDEFNRILGGNILLGTFLIVSIKNNRFVSMKKKSIRRFKNMFKLKKHMKRVEIFREEYLEEYYTNQRKMKQKNAKQNKEKILNLAA